jgi:hypothetical protein
MITFKVYFEALKNPDIVKMFGRPRIEGDLRLNSKEVEVDKKIVPNLALKEYNPKQIRAMVGYIKKYTKYNNNEKAEQRLIYLLHAYPKEMGIKMKLYLASLEPNSFNDVAVS